MADTSSSDGAVIPALRKKRSKSAISVVLPQDPFDSKLGVGIEDVRRLTEEKIYWTNEARAWKERAQELMAALREIAQLKHLPSDVEAILEAAEVRDMKCGPISLSLNSPKLMKKRTGKKRKEPLESVLIEAQHDKKSGKQKKTAAIDALKCLSQFLFDQPQGVDILVEHIPNIEVRSAMWKHPPVSKIQGPNGDSDPADFNDAVQRHKETSAGLCVSTYPFLGDSSTGGVKIQAGSPNCDYFTCSVFDQSCILSCVTDGCGWGVRSQTASRIANQTFVAYLERHLGQVSDLQQAALLLLRAVQEAHEKIIDGAKRAWEVGTTTLCGTVLFQVADEMVSEFGAPYAFLCVNVGDCKAYYCTKRMAGGETRKPSAGSLNTASSSNGTVAAASSSAPPVHQTPGREDSSTSMTNSKDSIHAPPKLRWNVTDITTGNRTMDVKLTGGHLGPKSGPNETLLDPDLGNFTIHLTPCSKGDMFVVVSDGVHDNLDPESLNIDPQEVGLPYGNWDEVPIEERTRSKDIYRSDLIAQHVNNTSSPSEIATNMLNWVRKVTEQKRSFMETNSGKEEPADLPGKMDHTTVVVFGVE